MIHAQYHATNAGGALHACPGQLSAMHGLQNTVVRQVESAARSEFVEDLVLLLVPRHAIEQPLAGQDIRLCVRATSNRSASQRTVVLLYCCRERARRTRKRLL